MPIKFYFYLAVALGLVGLGAFGSWKWQEAKILKAQTAEASAKGQAVSSALRTKFALEALSISEATSAKRIRALERQKADEQSYSKALESLLEERQNGNSNNVATFPSPIREWLALPVPNALRLMRRADSGCAPDLSVQCAEDGSRGDKDSSHDGSKREGDF